jgi:hypothetical protein
MGRSSVVMLTDTEGKVNVIGEPVRADAYFGLTDGLHTVAIYFQNFVGRVYIDASLSNNPTEDEWFPINLNGELPYLQYSREDGAKLEAPTGLSDEHMGKNGVEAFTFQGNFLWLRARVDRSYIKPFDQYPKDYTGTGTGAEGYVNASYDHVEVNQLGVVKKILLNH